MTTRDKTGNQLVDSIRKSKSGTVAQKTAARRPAGKSATTGRSRAAKTPAAPVEKPAGRDGGYSYGRRVWPD